MKNNNIKGVIKIATDIYSLKLEDITPENLLADETVKSILKALDPEGLSLSQSIIQTVIYSRIDELDERVIDLLAQQFHVDFYDLAGTLEMKREAVKGSLIWHMKKGTEWSILKALDMIGIKGEFLHWKDTGDEPYTFRIRAKITGDYYRTQGRDKITQAIRRAVMESKSARSLFNGLETSIEFTDQMNLYAGLFDALTGWQIIGLARIEAPGKSEYYAGLAASLEGERKIRLAHEEDRLNELYAGIVSVKNISHEIGIEEWVMHELLLRFEERIFTRIDVLQKEFTDKLKEHEIRLTDSLEEIKDILRWKGPDEEL